MRLCMIGNDVKRLSIVTLLLAGLVIGLAQGPAYALRLQPFIPGDYFAPVTLSRGESIRINTANLGSYSSVASPVPGKILVMFVSQDGTILNGNGRGRMLLLGVGRAASVRFSTNGAQLTQNRSRTKRAEAAPVIVRGVVLSLSGRPWIIQSSMEILDASGRTTLVLTPTREFILNPQPLPGG
jgi:hypothetical protein